MYRCPDCGREFAHRNQWHSCTSWTEADYLRGKRPEALALYRKFKGMVKRCGPVTLAPVKTSIGFKVRMTFARVSLVGKRIRGHLVLAKPIPSPRFVEVISPSPRNHIHMFEFTDPDELNSEVQAWLEEAYKVGKQEHLRSRSGGASPKRKSSR